MEKREDGTIERSTEKGRTGRSEARRMEETHEEKPEDKKES